MSKVAWYVSMRHVRDYYSGQQCASAGMTNLFRAAVRFRGNDVFVVKTTIVGILCVGEHSRLKPLLRAAWMSEAKFGEIIVITNIPGLRFAPSRLRTTDNFQVSPGQKTIFFYISNNCSLTRFSYYLCVVYPRLVTYTVFSNF